MPTLQETYDKVVAHLRKQGIRAMKQEPNGFSACVYRNNEGLKCAAGCLIPDEKYSPYMEGMAVVSTDITDKMLSVLLYAMPLEAFAIPAESVMTPGRIIMEEGHDLRLVAALQNVHDDHMPNQWDRALRNVCDIFNLKYEG